MPTQSAEKVPVYPHGVRVEVVPGEELQPWPEHLPIPRYAVFEWVPQPDGNFRPMMRVNSCCMIRMHASITEELGLGLSYAGLHRLIRAGFVRGERTTPNTMSFDLQSFLQHRAKVAGDPEFWTGKNLRRYLEAI